MTNQEQNRVICKSCNELTASSEMREVGDSAFCIPCFERLMALPVETEVVETKVVETPKVDSPSPNLSMYKCFVCNESMLGSPYKKMGNIGFCKECVDDLASYKAPESTSEVIRRKSEPPKPSAEPYISRATQRQAEPSFGEFGDKRCSQCSRRVLEPNGYSMIEDQVWCPICIREKPLPVPEKTEEPIAADAGEPTVLSTPALPSPTSAQALSTTALATPEVQTGTEATSPSNQPAWLQCDSCAKTLPVGQFNQIEGFNVCLACESTDREAALHLAKARHRKQMIALLQELSET